MIISPIEVTENKSHYSQCLGKEKKHNLTFWIVCRNKYLKFTIKRLHITVLICWPTHLCQILYKTVSAAQKLPMKKSININLRVVKIFLKLWYSIKYQQKPNSNARAQSVKKNKMCITSMMLPSLKRYK